MEGTTQFAWLQHAQLGAGFLRDELAPSTSQWCGFRGLVDELRVCYFVWTLTDIQRLASGKHTGAAMAYTLTRDLARGGHALSGAWLEATCSRPVERWVEITRWWVPRLLASRHLPSPPPQPTPPRGASDATPAKKRSLWQLVRRASERSRAMSLQVKNLSIAHIL